MINNKNSFIEDKIEIFNLLKKIQNSKQLISISFKSLPQHCLTSLLEVQRDVELLIFDEPNPLLGKKLIESKSEATFSLKLENLPVEFSTLFSANKISNELYANFPQKIHYQQNRFYYRFRTEFIKEIDATIFVSSTIRLPGQLMNISLNGLSLRFPYSLASRFKVDQLLNDIYLKLPNQNSFSFSAKVQNTRIENNYAHITLGLAIQKQNTSMEKTIQQFIFHSENG